MFICDTSKNFEFIFCVICSHHYCGIRGSVSDPDLYWIRIQTICRIRTRIRNQAVAESGSYLDPDPDQGFCDKEWIFFLKPLQRTFLLQEKSIKELFHYIFFFLLFWGQFWSAWVRIRIPNLDPLSIWLWIHSGSDTLIRSPPDLDLGRLAWAQRYGTRSDPDTHN